ncbi:hypothetical protein CW304_12350 [Bacillus sp. UFRGS-B20]|nr:hypothetical protein CW304_12350 [Bacillus sp. UFRGS-B20]
MRFTIRFPRFLIGSSIIIKSAPITRDTGIHHVRHATISDHNHSSCASFLFDIWISNKSAPYVSPFLYSSYRTTSECINYNLSFNHSI